MCGRFDEALTLQQLAERFAAAYDELSFEPRFNIAPTQDVPCVVQGDGGPEIKLFKWGLVPHWAKDAEIGHKMINARAETVAEKPSFRQSLQQVFLNGNGRAQANNPIALPAMMEHRSLWPACGTIGSIGKAARFYTASL